MGRFRDDARAASASATGLLAKTRLKKSGGSLILTMPASARNLLQLTEGQEMAVSVVGSAVVLEPLPKTRPMRVRRPKYTLDELVADADVDAALSDEERDWQDEPALGREIW